MISTILGPNLLGVFSADSNVITLLNFVGDAGFYFMPIFAGWSAAKKFNTNIPIAMFLAAVLIHPTLLSMVSEGTAFTVYGIPMKLVTYTSQFLPTILSVWILSYVYRFLNEHVPNSIKNGSGADRIHSGYASHLSVCSRTHRKLVGIGISDLAARAV